MDLTITFSKSASKHHIEHADVEWAFRTKKYDAVLEDEHLNGEHLLLGFSRNASLLEIVYRPIDEDTVKVIHAMRCQPKYYGLLEGEI
jgi:uncharacterized DUF497 family protein